MDSRKKSFATKRLGRISSNMGEGRGSTLGQKSQMPVIPSRWQFALLSCGSNAFGQIHQEDIMCSTIQVTQIPGTIDENGEAADILSISTGSQSTAAILPNHGVYMWGSGVGSFRVPTLLKLPEKVVVKSISCGESHAALITSNGKVLTWGNGEHGALGHGTKAATPVPKLVKALASLVCVSVSCGPYHTAFVAGDEEEISYIRVPPSASGGSTSSPSRGNSETEAIAGETANEFLICASLYTCGVGKAGQLGMGLSIPQSRSPRLVTWFGESGFKVARVSCGMHHTLVIGVPIHAMRMFTTAVFSFGWGEHGRLGLGNEDNVLEPTQVGFPEPFHAIDISAGEQHSLATSGRVGSCYAWGSNGFGQCGVGSHSQVEQCLFPTKVPVPEGMRISKVAAGGRHSAAISTCGQLLLWGWGEEGQLGNGCEKDSVIPRPCRIPAVFNSPSVPVTVSLGMCHTVVLVRNTMYRPSTPVPVVEEPVVSEGEPAEKNDVLPVEIDTADAVDDVETEVTPLALPPPASPVVTPPLSMEVKIVEEVIAPIKKEAVLVEEHDEEEAPPVVTPVAIRSLRDILSTREERREKPVSTMEVLETYIPEPPPSAVVVVEEVVEEEPEPPVSVQEGVPLPTEAENVEEIVNESKSRGTGGNMVQYFYKEGQNLDNCFVANSAKRAELRKQKKQIAEPDQDTAPRMGKIPATRPARKMSK